MLEELLEKSTGYDVKEVITLDFAHIQYNPSILSVEITNNSYFSVYIGDKVIAVIMKTRDEKTQPKLSIINGNDEYHIPTPMADVHPSMIDEDDEPTQPIATIGAYQNWMHPIKALVEEANNE